MNLLYTRLNAEWQDLHIPYPVWLTTIVMDELYYAVTLALVCTACFAVGLAVGFTVVIL
jgi:hypothetical protein